MKSLRNIGIVTIIGGALTSVGIMVSTTATVNSLSDLFITLGFYAWVTLPFIILIALTLYIHRKAHAPVARVAIFLTSMLVVLSSVLIYWDSTFNSESSTSALVFLFIPIYSFVATGLVYGLSWLMLRLFMPKYQA